MKLVVKYLDKNTGELYDSIIEARICDVLYTSKKIAINSVHVREIAKLLLEYFHIEDLEAGFTIPYIPDPCYTPDEIKKKKINQPDNFYKTRE